MRHKVQSERFNLAYSLYIDIEIQAHVSVGQLALTDTDRLFHLLYFFRSCHDVFLSLYFFFSQADLSLFSCCKITKIHCNTQQIRNKILLNPLLDMISRTKSERYINSYYTIYSISFISFHMTIISSK